jgi:hypothetical protein
MNAEKKSKRQARREQMNKQSARNRLIVGGIITLVAAFFLYAILRPILAPIADVVAVDSHERFMADGNSMGDPNAKIQITEYSDFQCPFCKRHYLEVEPLLEQYYIDTGKVFFTYVQRGTSLARVAAEATPNRRMPRKPPTAPRTRASSGKCTTRCSKITATWKTRDRSSRAGFQRSPLWLGWM